VLPASHAAEVTQRRGDVPHVVILGAGFAGLKAAKGLRKKQVTVTVIDRHNHHTFQPLLYQVATASLQPADIAGPIRQIVRSKNTGILLADVQGIDAARRVVQLDDREIPYDYLVVATGATHSYFGHEEWAKHAPGLKTLEDAVEMRRRIMFAFEAAERELNPELRREWLTFVVVGGGPTGVELAGALAEIARQTRAREFRHIDPTSARVLLIEGQSRLLSAYPEDLSTAALRSLEKKGVEVKTGTVVTELSDTEVLAGQERIRARTALWAAGVAASPLARSLGAELDRAGRVRVTSELTVPNLPNVFVVGDLAAVIQDGKPVPGLAPAAMAMGKHAARNIMHAIEGKPLEPFRYWDRGSFAVIGRGAAVGIMFQKVKVKGYLAWLAWLAIHIAFLVGFRSRLSVMFNWAYAYVTQRRYAQLIIGEGPVPQITEAPVLRPPQKQNGAPGPNRITDPGYLQAPTPRS
jgi:NADH dehydrogenase